MKEFLRHHIEKIIDVDDAEFQYILSHFTVRSLKKKEFLIRENDVVDHNFLLVSGLTKLYITDRGGNEHIVSFALEDWWETDSLAFFTQTKATMNLQCLENTTTFCLSFHNYSKLRSDMPKMEHFFLEKAVASHIAGEKRMLALTTLTAKERYEQLLAARPVLFQRLPKTLLASYLGVSRETLSRLTA